MTSFSHTRYPSSKEASDSYRAQLCEVIKVSRHTGRRGKVCIFPLPRWSEHHEHACLKLCEEVERRIVINDQLRVRGEAEAEFMMRQRKRDKARTAISESGKISRQDDARLNQESEDDERRSTRRHVRATKAVYARSNAASSRTLVNEPSGDQHASASESSYESGDVPKPVKRTTALPKKKKNVEVSNEESFEGQSKQIFQAREFLHAMGYSTKVAREGQYSWR